MLKRLLKGLRRLAVPAPAAPAPESAAAIDFEIGLGHWSEAGLDAWRRRWPHFSPAELASKGDGSLRISSRTLDMLEELRAFAGRPLPVSSCYRDPAHNARVGGAPLSRHKVSDAVDIDTRAFDAPARRELARAARRIGFNGVGVYLTFLHFDARPDGPASWFGSARARAAWLKEA